MGQGIQVAASILALLLLATTPLAAQEANAPGDAEVRNRLAFIQNSFDAGKRPADLWWYGWLYGYSAATAGQLAIYSNSTDEKTKQNMLVGAVTTALGAGGQIVFPLETGRFAVRLRGMPTDTPEARRLKLEAAEDSLRKAAAQETFGRSWKTQAMAAAVNVAAGLWISLYYHRPASDGFVTFAVGQLFAEAQIYSQPMRAVRDLGEYETRSDFADLVMPVRPPPMRYVRIIPGGLMLGCRF
jgi:hypothetical protein